MYHRDEKIIHEMEYRDFIILINEEFNNSKMIVDNYYSYSKSNIYDEIILSDKYKQYSKLSRIKKIEKLSEYYANEKMWSEYNTNNNTDMTEEYNIWFQESLECFMAYVYEYFNKTYDFRKVRKIADNREIIFINNFCNVLIKFNKFIELFAMARCEVIDKINKLLLLFARNNILEALITFIKFNPAMCNNNITPKYTYNRRYEEFHARDLKGTIFNEIYQNNKTNIYSRINELLNNYCLGANK